jgi:hypothetical protein
LWSKLHEPISFLQAPNGHLLTSFLHAIGLSSPAVAVFMVVIAGMMIFMLPMCMALATLMAALTVVASAACQAFSGLT